MCFDEARSAVAHGPLVGGLEFGQRAAMRDIFDWITPDELPVWATITLIGVSFVASAMTAALSIGGGLLLIAVMSALLPPIAVVPLHGIVMLGSNGGRSVVLRRHIDWPILLAFSVGSLAGAAVGGLIVTSLPATALRLAIAGFILFTQWGPRLELPTGRHAFGVAGAISMVLSLFVGATGPFVTAMLSKMDRIARHGLVATAGACMTVQHGFKIVVFGLAGFAFAPWAGLIIASILAGFAGTILGAKLLTAVPEALFRRALKYVLTVLAAYLAVQAGLDLVRIR